MIYGLLFWALLTSASSQLYKENAVNYYSYGATASRTYPPRVYLVFIMEF